MKNKALWLALFVSLPALAHEPLIPLMQCWREASEVACAAHFSHGPAVPGARYEVTDAQDKALLSGVTDQLGRLRFARPPAAFHVLLWDARGSLAEVGWRDVKENRPARAHHRQSGS